MAHTVFKTSIYTPEGVVFEGDVVSLVAPGVLGYFGVLAHHAPFVSLLSAGNITMVDARGERTVFCSESNGFFRVAANKAVFLLDSLSQEESIA